MNIGLDMMGGDFAPLEAVKGLQLYLSDPSRTASIYCIGDETLVKPFATAVPEIIDGLETRLFQNTTTSSLHSKPAKYNENDFEQAYIPILNRMNCKAYIHLSVYTDEKMHSGSL